MIKSRSKQKKSLLNESFFPQVCTTSPRYRESNLNREFELNPKTWRKNVETYTDCFIGKRTKRIYFYPDRFDPDLFVRRATSLEPGSGDSESILNLATDFGNQMCWWRVWDSGDRFDTLTKSPTWQKNGNILILSEASGISHHRKVTNIIMSPI